MFIEIKTNAGPRPLSQINSLLFGIQLAEWHHLNNVRYLLTPRSKRMARLQMHYRAYSPPKEEPTCDE